MKVTKKIRIEKEVEWCDKCQRKLACRGVNLEVLNDHSASLTGIMKAMMCEGCADSVVVSFSKRARKSKAATAPTT